MLFTGSFLWTACTEEEIDLYEGPDAIYFAQQWGVPHFVNNINLSSGSMRNAHQFYSKISFGEMIEPDSTLALNIQVSGQVKDYDRPFGIEVVTDSTTALVNEEYEIIDTDFKIPAGKTSTQVHILFHSTPRMDEKTYQLQLRLIPGEHFVIPFDSLGYGKMPIIHVGSDIRNEYGLNTDPNIHNIFMNNFLVRPARWNDFNMGVWSEKKYRLLLDYTGEMLGWNVKTWNSSIMWDGSAYSVGVTFLGKYLKEQYLKGREHWVLDPDGTMMWVKSPELTGLWSDDTRPENMTDI